MNDHDFEKLEIPLITKLANAYKEAHKFLSLIPKFEKYTLGEKIENSIIEAVEFTVMANSASKYEKEKYLLKVNAKIELLKLLYRFSLHCNLIDERKYLEIQLSMQEMGKMTQGWIKYTRNLK